VRCVLFCANLLKRMLTMSRNYLLFLDDIRSSCSGMTKEEFLADEKTYDAVLHQLTIIGEAAKQIPQEVRDLYLAVDWKE
jgi:uncharacterized protein with HEPN domain